MSDQKRTEFVAEFADELSKHVSWCPTCGTIQETPDECPPCAAWRTSNPPPDLGSLKYGYEFPKADLKPG
jgi:hypothetical protein